MARKAEDRDKLQMQEDEYAFPYHYIPHFTKKGRVALSRRLSWGLEYLCYQRHVFEAVRALNPSSVLDVGCGDGYFIGSLANTIPVRVGVDLSDRSIAFAKAFHPECRFLAGDVATVEGCFDVVISIEVLEHIPETQVSHFFQAIGDRLVQNGTAIIGVPTTVVPLARKHYRHYTLDLFEQQLAQSNAGLRVVSHDYVFKKPCWYGAFKWLFNNHLFSLEIKPLVALAWKRILSTHRLADRTDGCHLVVYLKKHVA